MGLVGAIVGGALLGFGASALMNKGQQGNQGYNYTPIQYQPSGPVKTVEKPIDVNQTEQGTTNNAQMEAEREKERQAAALRKQQNNTILTSGLGASGTATTQKKGLLGG